VATQARLDHRLRRAAAPGCQIAVEFQDPDGNNLEIYWNMDQVGTTGGVRPPEEWRPARTLEDAVANPVAGQRVP